MVKKELPNFSILLEMDDPLVTNEIISLFKENNIQTRSESYSTNYPYTTWTDEYLVAANNSYKANIRVKTKEEFLSYFFTSNIIEVW